MIKHKDLKKDINISSMNLIKTKIRLGIKIIKLGGIGMYPLLITKIQKLRILY